MEKPSNLMYQFFYSDLAVMRPFQNAKRESRHPKSRPPRCEIHRSNDAGYFFDVGDVLAGGFAAGAGTFCGVAAAGLAAGVELLETFVAS